MEAGEESGNANLKRPRAPLSDSEDNIPSASEVNDGQKRRRLEAPGQENHSPTQSNSVHPAEQGKKPDTPMVPSVCSRVQQLTQRREEGTPLTQRRLSGSGAGGPIHNKSFMEHLLAPLWALCCKNKLHKFKLLKRLYYVGSWKTGEGEFSQRMERFKAPVFQADPTLGPASPCSWSCSNFVSGIHQKLQETTMPSSKQASRMRQEREQELSQLNFQPIRENVWMKGSSSDLALAEQVNTPPGPSPSSWVPVSRRRIVWPPMQSRDVDGDAQMKDCSLTETSTSGAVKSSVNTTGEMAPCVFEAPPASVELESSREGQLQMELKNQNTHQGQEVREKKDHKASVGNEEDHVGSQQPESQTILKLSFGEDQNVSGDEQSLLEPTCPEELNVKETSEVSEVTEQSDSERFEKIDSSYGEEEIEPSTDEEMRLWRYPQSKVYTQGDSTAEEQKKCVCAEEEEMITCSSELHEDEKPRPEKGKYELECCIDDAVKGQSTLRRDQGNIESCKGYHEGETTGDINAFAIRREQKNTEGCTYKGDICQESTEIQAVTIKEDMDLESDRTGPTTVKQMGVSPFANVGYTDLQGNIKNVAQAYAKPVDTDTQDAALSLTGVQMSECHLEREKEAVDERQGITDGQTEDPYKAEGREGSKKVTFILEPELIGDVFLAETNTSMKSRAESSMSDVELSHDETKTAQIIDQMFEEVLEYAGKMDETVDNEDAEDHDSGIGACSGDMESEKEKSEEKGEAKEERDENSGDELLTFPLSSILSPLSKSVEAVVTPLRLAASQESNPPSPLLTPEDTTPTPAEFLPLYSIDAYRTQRQSKLPAIQSVTPAAQMRAPEKSQVQHSVATEDKIMSLDEEAGKLQTVISQTLQALSCCTDEEHGQGSLEEAEAEKLLLVSSEKRSALLAEVARLREERNLESGEVAGEDRDYVSQQPCRGTVNITNIQLPLKVEFVCSSHSRTGRPSHYFFVLIRYGPHNIVTTPLATPDDAQNGDTISFPTSVTLKDIRSSFKIDVEVYSLSHTPSSNCSTDRATTKSRVTPRKLLNTITRSSNSLPSGPSTLNTRRSSNFCLVGSHKITLASLGHSKFPLDKMKLEGKIRRLLGDEFQDKVPFLSPLEGNIYLRLDSESHSNVQHQGFLTMFGLISGYGVWHRRYFVLEGCSLSFWNHPNDKETKEAEGSISLSSSPNQCVRPVKRDSCARPFTFELVSTSPHQQQDNSQEALSKCWFSADTKQERLDWMEKLSQALLDFHTWNQPSATQTESRESDMSSSGNLRESML
uniref:anillin, actin binding protein 2 isoform X3 n=1 Tax=Monopterus albus TaxID=43700 RepID=UPI0009B4BB44|nr:uncharacterized protein LOC109951266 isoform X3 [Monopterus albus]